MLTTTGCGGREVLASGGGAQLLVWFLIGQEVVVLVWRDETLLDVIICLPLVCAPQSCIRSFLYSVGLKICWAPGLPKLVARGGL